MTKHCSSEKETEHNMRVLERQRIKSSFRAQNTAENSKTSKYFGDRAEFELSDGE